MRKTMIRILIILILILSLIVIVIGILNSEFFLRKIYRIEYQEYVEKYSEEYNIDPLLVYSIIKAESNFNEGALSKKGACGLMQLMDQTAKEVAENTLMDYESGITLYDAEKNIKIGIAYYADLKKTYSNDEVALAAYNAGSGNVDKWIEDKIINADGSNIENIPYKETNTYVRKILKNYKMYKKLYQQ